MPDAEFHGEKETFWLVAHVEVHAEVGREAAGVPRVVHLLEGETDVFTLLVDALASVPPRVHERDVKRAAVHAEDTDRQTMLPHPLLQPGQYRGVGRLMSVVRPHNGQSK